MIKLNALVGAAALALIPFGMAILIPAANYRLLRWLPEAEPALYIAAFAVAYLAVAFMLPTFLPNRKPAPHHPPLLRIKVGRWWFRTLLAAGARPAPRIPVDSTMR